MNDTFAISIPERSLFYNCDSLSHRFIFTQSTSASGTVCRSTIARRRRSGVEASVEEIAVEELELLLLLLLLLLLVVVVVVVVEEEPELPSSPTTPI
jgi:hypothetical protein